MKNVPYRKKKRWGLVAANQKAITPFVYEQLVPYPSGHYAIQRKKRFGVLSADGAEILPCAFDSCDDESEGLFRVYQSKNPAHGFVRAGGGIAIPFQFAGAQSFDGHGLACAQKDGLWGYIDKAGTFVVPPVYFVASSFEDDVAIVLGKGSKWGVIDRKGKAVIPFAYSEIERTGGNLLRVKKGSKLGLMRSDGSEVVAPKYQSIFCDESRARFQLADRSGLLDLDGREIVPARYDSMDRFSDGLARVEDAKGRSGYIDGNGKVVIPLRSYEGGKPGDFSEGLAHVPHRGFMSHTGEIVLPCDYDGAYPFDKGLAWVYRGQLMESSLFGLIDRKGKEVVRLRYFSADEFKDGIAPVEKKIADYRGELLGYIDRAGKEYWSDK
jgi:hypothetical protein